MLEIVSRYFRNKSAFASSETFRRTGTRAGPYHSLAARPMLTLWLASGSIVVGLLILFALELRSEYTATISNAERASQSFADVLAEHTAKTFEAVNISFRAAMAIRHDFDAGRITPEAANLALRGLQESSPALLALGWTNAAGDIVARSDGGGPSVGPNISDLPYFDAQRDGQVATFYIAPLYKSKIFGRWVTSVSLRLNNADGSFAGVLAAPIDPSYFARVYQSVNIAADDVVTVVSKEGNILFREPFSESVIGQSLKDTSLFLERIPRSPFGAFTSLSPVDGRERIFAYRVVPGLPLIMLVLQDRAKVLARWYEHIEVFGPMVFLLVLIVTAGTAALSRRTKQLTEKSALLEATLDNMQQGLIVVDRADRIAICNRRAMELLDLPESLMATRPLSKDVIDYQARNGEFNEATEEIKARLHPRLMGETTNIYERRRPNGTVLEILTVPFVSGGTIRTYKDITSWKKIEKELKDGETRYRLLADNATDMIFTLDLNFVRQYVSPASREILGYFPEELVGKKPVNMIHPEDADQVDKTYGAVLGGLSRASVTNRIRHRDGRWIWVEAELRLVRDAETDFPVGILGALRDVSVRKALEEEAAAARQQAEKAAEMQAQFWATMSHELRTPLNSIVGFADIVLDRSDLAPDSRRQIGLIQTASETLLTVVNDVLDFSKIEEGKLTLAPVTFDFPSLIDKAVAIVRGLAATKGLDLRISLDERISIGLFGDDQRIRQILLNLLNNAIKFTQAGYVSVIVELVAQDETTQHLKISVLDTGIGIPAAKLGQLFQRFNQGDSSISRLYGGSGLGLAISKRLVEIMGGEIGVESEPGNGSKFWFSLDLPTCASSSNGLPSDVAIDELVSAHLLLVEDVEVNREIACAILESMGYRVDAVSDGLEAIDAVQRRNYDLVLMDVQMPGMDGLSATRKIRALPGNVARIPIVAMTANALPTQIEATRLAGMSGYVGKPFKRRELRGEIERCRLAATQVLMPEQRERLSPAKIDEKSIAMLTDMLGAMKVKTLFEGLKSQLELFTSWDLASHKPADLAAQAHRIVSSAGMLGFIEVSEYCSRFERATLDGFDQDALFKQARNLCVRALAELSLRLSPNEDIMQPKSDRG